MTPHVAFVAQRLDQMAKTPGMWAGTQSAFGLQLVLLVEFAQITKPDMYKAWDITQRIFGPGPAVEDAPLTDEWARDKITVVRAMLHRELG